MKLITESLRDLETRLNGQWTESTSGLALNAKDLLLRSDTSIILKMKKRKDRKKQLKALKKESAGNLTVQIRRQLALPMIRRTNFLRQKTTPSRLMPVAAN